jgi:hypothetical protein
LIAILVDFELVMFLSFDFFRFCPGMRVIGAHFPRTEQPRFKDVASPPAPFPAGFVISAQFSIQQRF